jgi:diguanylate cyclase (GGDEF)-like protein
LTKPCNTHELRVRLRAGRRILELQEQLLEASEALRVQATHDGLTGLLNRSSILETLQKELLRSQREHNPVAVLMMDLDRFKNINDTHGHLAGDAVLREASRRMTDALRRYDAVGRYGGEEFLVVLPGCEADAAAQQAERLRGAIAGEPFDAGTATLAITCSIGVACRTQPSEADTDSLVKEADCALYTAKRGGRNRVESYTVAMVAA